jgi:hypothetical protein
LMIRQQVVGLATGSAHPVNVYNRLEDERWCEDNQTMRTCLWCGGPLPKGRRKYCSDEHSWEYFVHHIKPLWWNHATLIALERANHKCEVCGSEVNLEVHHKEKLGPGEPRHNNPKNRQDNLVVLCRYCHEKQHHTGSCLSMGKGIPVEELPLFAWAGVRLR